MIYLYRDVETGQFVDVVRKACAMPDDLEVDGRRLRRVYTVPEVGVRVGGQGVVYGPGKLPVSRSLPHATEQGVEETRYGQKVRRLKCGAFATEDGGRIVDSADAAKRHASDTGMYWERTR